MKANSSSSVVARLTITRTDGKKTMVEVHSGASFHSFYQVFIQIGRRWSTKRFIRTASRNEGLSHINAHLQQPGLEAVAKRIAVFQSTTNPIVSTKIEVIKKKAYRRLLAAAPESLGMTKSRVNVPMERFSRHPHTTSEPIRVRLHISEAVVQR